MTAEYWKTRADRAEQLIATIYEQMKEFNSAMQAPVKEIEKIKDELKTFNSGRPDEPEAIFQHVPQ